MCVCGAVWMDGGFFVIDRESLQRDASKCVFGTYMKITNIQLCSTLYEMDGLGFLLGQCARWSNFVKSTTTLFALVRCLLSLMHPPLTAPL